MLTHGNKKRILIIALFLVVVLGAYYIISALDLDTRSRRKKVSAQVNSLTLKFLTQPHRDDVLDEIISHLEGDYEFGRIVACDAIRRIGPRAKKALGLLMNAANSGDRTLETVAVRAIGSFGPDGAPAIDLLIEKVCQPGTDTAWYAAEALGRIGPPAINAIPFLQDAAESEFALSRFAKEALVILESHKKRKEEKDMPENADKSN